MLADLLDLLAAAHTDAKKRSSLRPYPRPSDPSDAGRFGRTSLPQQEIRAALAARGH